MKNVIKILIVVLIVVFTVAFSSCKNNKTEKVEYEQDQPMDTAKVAVVFEPFKLIVNQHKVADYDKWRKAYESHDSVRRAYA